MKDFKAAERKAGKLGATGVSVTSYAVFAHGPEKWVCAEGRCLAVNSTGPPLRRHLCGCGAVLAP